MVRKSMEFAKSIIRKTILEKFPQCTHSGDRRWFREETADIVFIDLMQQIKIFEPAKEGSTRKFDGDIEIESVLDYGSAVKSMIHRTIRRVNMSLGADTGNPHLCQPENDQMKPLTVVITLDKYKYVCGARTIVHTKRKSVKGDENSRIEEGEFRRPVISDPIAYSFAQITEDKKYNSPVLFNFVMSNMMIMLDSMELRRDVYFVFDGHCMADEDISMMPHFDRVDVDDGAYYDTPILFQYTINRDERVIRWLPTHKNTIGEGDFIPYFYTNKYTEMPWSSGDKGDTIVVDVYSIDTDSLIYCLLYIAMGMIEGSESAKTKMLLGYDQVKKGSTMKWVDINKLVELIDKTMGENGGSQIQYPSLQLGIASLAVGSDYTERHAEFPQNHFINAYIEYCYNIGDIVKISTDSDEFYKLRLSGNEYTRYIAMGYYSSKSKNKKWEGFHPDHYEREQLYLAVREKMVKEYPLDDKFWLPSDTDIVLSAKQLQYYINMLSRLGESSVDIEVQDSNMELYGYKYVSDENTDELVMVRELHTYDEDDIIRLTESVHGIKATDKLIERKKVERKRKQEKEADKNANRKVRKFGSSPRKSGKAIPEYIEGLDLD